MVQDHSYCLLHSFFKSFLVEILNYSRKNESKRKPSLSLYIFRHMLIFENYIIIFIIIFFVEEGQISWKINVLKWMIQKKKKEWAFQMGNLLFSLKFLFQFQFGDISVIVVSKAGKGSAMLDFQTLRDLVICFVLTNFYLILIFDDFNLILKLICRKVLVTKVGLQKLLSK